MSAEDMEVRQVTIWMIMSRKELINEKGFLISRMQGHMYSIYVIYSIR